MTEHTPGPWLWTGVWLDGEGGEGDHFIVKSLTRTTEADKALIAAAPEMLKALRFVQEHGLALKDSPMFEIVAHAIDKAEGKTDAILYPTGANPR